MDRVNSLLQTMVASVWFMWTGIAMVFTGLVLLFWVVVLDADGAPRRMWARYCAYLESKLRVLFIWTPGDRIAAGQAAGIFAAFGFAILVEPGVGLLLAGAIAIGPPAYIEMLRRRRVSEIEKQLDGFLLAIANALKATPSLGDAFISVQQLIRPPLQQEIELAVKEMRVGSTLEQALLFMANRIASRQVDSAISALLIGRQVGGNLPKILDGTSATLREMSRLEAVVRTKTAEGKAQLALLSVFPLVLILAFNAVKENYFDPLTQSITGYAIIAVAGLCWIASLVIARKIVSVDV
jgi:tight adherence protein B